MREIVNRLFIFILSIWLVLTIHFFVGRLAPGSPFQVSEESTVGSASTAFINQKYGLDKTVCQQYLDYCKKCIRTKSFGSSYHHKNKTVLKILCIDNICLKTLEIVFFSFVLGVMLSIFFGAICAIYSSSFLAYFLHFFLSLIAATPIYLLQPFMVRIFVIKFKVFASGGWGDSLFGDWYHLALPVLLLSLKNVAELTRYVEESIQDVLSSSYIRAAYAKGLSFKTIFFSHALKPSILPLFHVFASSFLSSLFSSAYLETTFCIFGFGRAVCEVSDSRDYNLMLGLTACFLFLSQVIMFIPDYLQKKFNPKQVSKSKTC